MGQGRIIVVLLLMIAGFGVMVHLFTSAIAPPETDLTVTAFNLSRPRAPAEARKLLNPFLLSKEMVERGKHIYHEKGGCYVCHGDSGLGDGEAGALLSPKPTNLADANFHLLRKDGELWWAIRHGVEGTGMFSYAPRTITEDEAWIVIHYIRTFNESS